jgi:hypothetical protein
MLLQFTVEVQDCSIFATTRQGQAASGGAASFYKSICSGSENLKICWFDF